MSTRKHPNQPRLTSHKIKVPARVISASEDVADERRARTNSVARIIRTVKPLLGSVTRVSDDLAIVNILSDLRHYCDFRDLAFKKLNKAAGALYLEEKANEAMADPGWID
jgi:hypothetical protein